MYPHKPGFRIRSCQYDEIPALSFAPLAHEPMRSVSLFPPSGLRRTCALSIDLLSFRYAVETPAHFYFSRGKIRPVQDVCSPLQF